MTPASSRRFFTAFYDVLSRYRQPFPPLGPAACINRSYATRHPPTSSFFFGASPFSTPRSRYVVSRGFAGFCVCSSVPGTAGPTTSVAASTVVAETTGSSVLMGKRGGILARLGLRGIHTPRKKRRAGATGTAGQRRRNKSSDALSRRRAAAAEKAALEAAGVEEKVEMKALPAPAKEPPVQGIFERVYHIHRPTKDEMLAAATGMWQRIRIRTKWSLIRQMRPYSLEDITAFFSWMLLGHVVWVVVGTTTFLSVAIFLVNSVFAQETLAGLVGNYLTKETGVTVVFESAIVPRWKDNCIQFRNVFVSRRPRHGKHSRNNVSKGSALTAAAAAAAAKEEALIEEDEDTNYTQFDVTIETVNVNLSFARWMNGKGLLKDVEIRGVRGVIDRTHVFWAEGVDARSFKHEHQPGDFEIESFKIEDLLVTVYQPDGFRPFPVSIYSCDLPQLRKQWLFYDFLSANKCSGSYDNSLFTIHPRQSHNILPEGQNPWKRTSRLRIDGLEIDHLNRGVEGPFGWIQQGNVDMVADVNFPLDDNLQFSKLVHDIYEHMEATVISAADTNPDSTTDFAKIIKSIGQLGHKGGEEKFLVLDLHLQLNDMRAAVPLFTNDLSYVNNAMIRPIVAYVNSRKTYIPINCRVVKGVTEFDGSWTVYDSGLMDDLSAETYEAFSRNVANEQARRRRMKKVGLWSLQLLAQALLMAMAGSVA